MRNLHCGLNVPTLWQLAQNKYLAIQLTIEVPPEFVTNYSETSPLAETTSFLLLTRCFACENYELLVKLGSALQAQKLISDYTTLVPGSPPKTFHNLMHGREQVRGSFLARKCDCGRSHFSDHDLGGTT